MSDSQLVQFQLSLAGSLRVSYVPAYHSSVTTVVQQAKTNTIPWRLIRSPRFRLLSAASGITWNARQVTSVAVRRRSDEGAWRRIRSRIRLQPKFRPCFKPFILHSAEIFFLQNTKCKIRQLLPSLCLGLSFVHNVVHHSKENKLLYRSAYCVFRSFYFSLIFRGLKWDAQKTQKLFLPRAPTLRLIFSTLNLMTWKLAKCRMTNIFW